MFVCEVCGTIHPDQVVCCDKTTVSFEEAIGNGGKLFELTGNERAQHVLGRLKAQYEAAAQKVNRAEEKVETLRQQRDEAGAVLLDFYKLSVPAEKEAEEPCD